MKRLVVILFFFCLSVPSFSQGETRVVDSLLSIVDTQEGREKVLTMIELTWEFYDVSFDDCIDWGERAIEDAKSFGFADLEAKANYALGIQYSYHGDLDLAKRFLMQSYGQFTQLGDIKNAFESIWNIATSEMALGSIDTAYQLYEHALGLAVRNSDTSACAYVNANMGLISYKRGDFDAAFTFYKRSIELFRSVGDEEWALRQESYLATLLLENGQPEKARSMYWRLMPVFEKNEDNYRLFLANKNLGSIYESHLIDFDSAKYYFQKAIEYSEMPMPNNAATVSVRNDKSSAVVGIANVLAKQGEKGSAIEKYKEALAMASERKYQYGQMEACLGLMELYSQLGQCANSLQYYVRYVELERVSGITMMRPSVTKHLAMDYARLGRFDDLYVELERCEDENASLMRENADFFQQNQSLSSDFELLLNQHEAQNQQIDVLQSQRDQYRLAFFGLLAIALFALVLWIAYKIVRKKRSKIEKG